MLYLRCMPVYAYIYNSSVIALLFRGSQSLILNLGCTIGHSYCLNQASTLFKQWLQVTAMGLNPEVVEIVMYFGMYHCTVGTCFSKDLFSMFS